MSVRNGPPFEWPEFQWWGPRGSGAFITPGEEWPFTLEKLIKNKWIWVGVAALVLLVLAGRAD
ncbi:unnamed protein product [marine sediment metagenome]|uniref:Uncharacterized protein n=1 Tax=marine sediment metagenome TaxID=412755 RepID=X1MEE3_9ZZZZ